MLVVGTHSIHVRRFVAGLCAAGQPVVLATDAAAPLLQHPLLREQVLVDFALRRFATVRRLRDIVARWRPRLLHAHQANSVGWHAVRAARGRLPVVLTLWGSDVLTLPARSPLHRWMVRYTLRHACAWTADAKVLLQAAQAVVGGTARSTETLEQAWIPLGIDAPAPAAAEPRELRLFSCRLHKPLYRVDAILQAFARLPEDCADWVLEVAATGSETASLRQLAATLGIESRVEWSGMLDAAMLARSYRRSAVFVSVPTSDGTSVSLLEAMAAGCLPVLSDLPANREWVDDDRNGILVDDMGHLDHALQRAIAWWRSGRWQAEGAPFNERLITERALFTRNIQQFLGLYDRVTATVGEPR